MNLQVCRYIHWSSRNTPGLSKTQAVVLTLPDISSTALGTLLPPFGLSFPVCKMDIKPSAMPVCFNASSEASRKLED